MPRIVLDTLRRKRTPQQNFTRVHQAKKIPITFATMLGVVFLVPFLWIGSAFGQSAHAKSIIGGRTFNPILNDDHDDIPAVPLSNGDPTPSRKETARPWALIPKSIVSARTRNPIRDIVEGTTTPPDIKGKPFIPLSIGDPTLDGNLRPPEGILEAMKEALETHAFDGYGPATGLPTARAAIARYHEENFATKAAARFASDDVVVTSGASHALGLAIGALCDEGDNLLLPEPCFSLYRNIADNLGVVPRYYKCDPENNFAIDIDDLKSKVDGRTKAILTNNPSNPCGSNFARHHVEDLMRCAEDLKLPVISDEIYAGLVFGENEVFTSCADVECSVPRLIVGGLAKNFMVPGWRVGWVLRKDPVRVLDSVWGGLTDLAALLMGPNLPVQSVLPKLLLETPRSYHDRIRKELSANGNLCFEKLRNVPGLTPSVPRAAMYVMVRIDLDVFRQFKDDVEFSRALLAEEGLMVLPGQVFRAPGFFRIVTAKSEENLAEAMDRIVAFCDRHAVAAKRPQPKDEMKASSPRRGTPQPNSPSGRGSVELDVELPPYTSPRAALGRIGVHEAENAQLFAFLRIIDEIPAIEKVDHCVFVAPIENRENFYKYWSQKMGFQHRGTWKTLAFPADHMAFVRGGTEHYPWTDMIGLTVHQAAGDDNASSPTTVLDNAPIQEALSLGAKTKIAEKQSTHQMQHIAFNVRADASMEDIRETLESRGLPFMTDILTYRDAKGAGIRQLFSKPNGYFFYEFIQRIPNPVDGEPYDGFDPDIIDNLYRALDREIDAPVSPNSSDCQGWVPECVTFATEEAL